MNRNNAYRNRSRRCGTITARTANNLRWQLRSRKWINKVEKLFILDPEQ